MSTSGSRNQTNAIEAAIAGVPGVAVSTEAGEPPRYEAAAGIAGRLVQSLGEHGLPTDTLLNVNIPFLKKEEVKGFRVTRQGLRVYHSRLDERLDPRNRNRLAVLKEPRHQGRFQILGGGQPERLRQLCWWRQRRTADQKERGVVTAC